MSCWPLAGGLQPCKTVLLSYLLLELFLPAGLCLVLHRTGLSCSEQLWERGSGWVQGMLRLVKVLLGRK